MKKQTVTISATIGVALMICLTLISCGGTGQKTTQGKEQISQNNRQNIEAYEKTSKSKSRTVQFNTVSEVYAYLTGNTFVNDNGDRMSFSSELCVYVNGECLSYALKVVDYNTNGAELRGSTPYGTRLHIAVLPEASCVLDLNGGDRYYIRGRR